MESDEHVARMRRIADDDPEDASKQLLVGAFLLDQGRLADGRATIERGYELLLRNEVTPPDGPRESSRRCAPDFLIVGPQKTGTSSLYGLLTQHRHVVPAPRKEIQFWGRRHGRPAELYEAYFPRLPVGLITGEASPTYLGSAEAAEAVGTRYPDVRVIVLHRDPTARAYSHYQMMKRLSLESHSFDEAISAELRQIGDTPPLRMDDVLDSRHRYLLDGCNLPYLRMWVDAVGPERVMVIESAALSQHRQAAVDAVHDFLGLPASSVDGIADRNVHEYAPPPEAVVERLREWFAPHEAALEEYLSDHPTLVRFGHG